jgi:hypothetical protein
MYRAAEAVERALDEMARASGVMKAAAPRDPREGFELLRNPRTALKADLVEAREAQARRIDRGELP